ncbi:MAG: alpha/beta fold hydrolase [Planctomycetota bacterium]
MVVALAMLAVNLPAEEKGNESDDIRPAQERSFAALPKYRHPYSDGLYSTVTAMNTFGIPENAQKLKKLKLKVAGFKKEAPIYAILQDYEAPLVVILMGMDGKVTGPWGDLFPYWYSESGYHVLTFDSSFTPQYPAFCGQGVVGNFDAEADQIAAIIAAFLKTPEASKKVNKIGVIGMSFGGTQALLLAAKAKAAKLPFALSGCLALSPSVKLKTAARIVDRFFIEDRWNTTMIELGKKFMSHRPVAEGQTIPFKAADLRAAIGFAFRDGLTQVVERNDRAYNLKILPSEESGEHRGTWAEATGFERFIEEYTFPYWQKKGAVKSVEELWEMADLVKILPRLPGYAEAVVAANDPFVTSEDIAAAQAADQGKNLIVLPNGGHLGFIAADWTLVKALRIFKEKQPELEQLDRNALDRARQDVRDAAKEGNKKK